MDKDKIIKGVDIELKKLIPLKERLNLNLDKNKGFKKILASIKSVGLIEPLVIFVEDDKFIILDGYLRFKACEQLGVEIVPCIIHSDKEAYTFNRMVNRLGNYQEQAMMKRAMEEIDEQDIAEAFGLKSIKHRLSDYLLKKLHPKVIKAYKSEELYKKRAEELSSVSFDRQLEILKAMRETKDYSKQFTHAMLLNTPTNQRVASFRQKILWAKNAENKHNLVARLKDAQEQKSFFKKIYSEYNANILKIVPYIRSLMSVDEIRFYLMENHVEICKYFHKVIEEEVD